MLTILDTDVLSNLRKEKKHPAVVAWVQQMGWADLSTTVINISEIQCGIERQRPTHPVYAAETERWLGRLLEAGAPYVWPLGTIAALIFARMHETPALRQFVVSDPRGKRLASPGDLAIAAIAIDLGAVIATGNVAHFRQIHAVFPLPGVFDPFRSEWVIAAG